MLANTQRVSSGSGSLDRSVQLPATSLHELLDFIGGELPRWRDRDDRPEETSETSLTSALCAHLNSAARHSIGWDFVQFRTEEPDGHTRGRKIDLAAAPCGATVWIEGRKHIDFDTLLPIECKRLPTPKDHKRDEREYVISRSSSTGGIQRFKVGLHGANHNLAAMIGYVQQEPRAFWNNQVSAWITNLAETGEPGWTMKDLLQLVIDDDTSRVAVLRSSHTRENNLPDIALRHFWVSVN